MYSVKIPKTIKVWAEKKASLKDGLVWVEYNEFEPCKGSYSLWCNLKEGFIVGATESCFIHEPTAKSFLESAKTIIDNR
jgi:hypothetical protein